MLWPVLQASAVGTHVDTALTRVAASSLRIAKTANLGRLGLPVDYVRAVDLLRVRPLTIAEFPRVSGLAERDARLLAYLLLVTKQVEVLSSATSMRPMTTPGPSIPSVSGRPTPSPMASPSMPPGGLAPTPVPPSPRAAVSKSLIPPGSSRSKPPPGMPLELAERWRGIIDRARTIDRADYFNMLELARDSTPEEAQESFYGLAKKWHPDRLPNDLAPVKEACARVFSRMSEAHATLTDPEKRVRYMRLLADGSGSPEMQETVARVVEAATDFQKAEVCFKRNDLVQAEELCRKAVKLDATQPDYQALLAWLVALKRENQTPEKVVECIQMLDRAIQLSDRCEKAYLYRGMLYKRVNRNESAMRDFRRVVELNPNNIDAAREVRLHNMRGGPQRRSTPPSAARSTLAPKANKPEEGKGILGRFFKK
jgi:tetratricopeptide (TPR) repeat protein